MNVKEIAIEKFMTHDKTTVTLPDSGVVVVTGANGSGKSSLLESVSWAMWGKTLRKASPVPPEATCKATVTAEGVTSTRTSTGKRTSLAWQPIGEDAVRFETTTKAQRALCERVGEWDTWRRTHTFGSDALSFSQATDSERKKLLESLLGLDRFETAYRECREDLGRAADRLKTLKHKAQISETRLTGLEERYQDAKRALQDVAPPDTDELPDLTELDEIIRDLRARSADIKRDLINSRSKLGGAQADVQRAERDSLAIMASVCSTCGQDISQETRDKLAIRLSRAKAQHLKETEIIEKKEKTATSNLNAIQTELDEASRQRADAAAIKSARNRQATAAERAADTMGRVSTQMEACEAELTDLELAAEDAQTEVDLLTMAASVLSTKGYRAQMLTDALGALEQAANGVLDHLTGGSLRIRLRSYTETAGGKVTESISLALDGAGGGQGYRGASAGERRRVDVALVLALAQLSGSGGTLWFDEVFDALDANGVDRLADLLSGLAADRCVVVITHSREFSKKVSAAKRWHVDGGKIRN